MGNKKDFKKKAKPAFLRFLDKVVRFVIDALSYFVIGGFVLAPTCRYLGFPQFAESIYHFMGPFFLALVCLLTAMGLMITSDGLSKRFADGEAPVAKGTKKNFKKDNQGQREPVRDSRSSEEIESEDVREPMPDEEYVQQEI